MKKSRPSLEGREDLLNVTFRTLSSRVAISLKAGHGPERASKAYPRELWTFKMQVRYLDAK
jgi:hypothetical protein